MRDFLYHLAFALAFIAVGGLGALTYTAHDKRGPDSREECLSMGYEDVLCYAYFKN